MSTSPPALFAGLFDDAAVFPPGNHAIDEALRRRFERAATTDARYVGSFLLPPTMIERCLQEVHPVDVVVIGRPGTPLDDVIDAANTLAHNNTHALAGVQIALQGGWEKLLDLGVPVAIELSPVELGTGLNALMPHREQVAAKLRTGSTPTNPVPTPTQLAQFVDDCMRCGLSFKLTGGMHRALTHDTEVEREFGFLNVLAATHLITQGSAAAAKDAERMLDADRDEALGAVQSIDDSDAQTVRDWFLSFGCCDVDDPIDDLRTLGLI